MTYEKTFEASKKKHVVMEKTAYCKIKELLESWLKASWRDSDTKEESKQAHSYI